MRTTVRAEFKLFGVLKRQKGWYVAYCPPLDITTQGRTKEEAKRNLLEASELFVTSCFERGTFEQALRELGWHLESKSSQKNGRNGKQVLPAGAFALPIPVPFGFENAAECPA